MFNINVIPNVEMRVAFTHYYPHATVCRLWLDEGYTFKVSKNRHIQNFVSGTSKCHPGDQWNPNVGRKIALKHALDFAQIDRKTRAKIWNRYFETRGKVN